MIDYLEHHITDHCNLNCAGCSHFSPLAPTWFEQIDEFEKDFGVLSLKTYGEVGTIRIMGGEPLLHPYFDRFLIMARDLFPYSEIQLVTNGLLVKKFKHILQPLCNQLRIIICISDYGLEGFDMLDTIRGFQYVRIDWKNQFYNIGLDVAGAQDPLTAFKGCDLHVNKWFYFQGGRFYPCCVGANLKHFINYFNLPFEKYSNDSISISVHEHSIEEIEDFLAKPIPLCKYCHTATRKNKIDFKQSQKEISEWTYQ